MERKINVLEKRLKSNPDKVSKSYIEKSRIELLEISSALDAKRNLLRLFRNLGKTEGDIEKKLSKEQEFTQLANLINQGIVDGEDANSGTKKIISDIFVTSTGTIDLGKLRSAKNKLNDE